MEYPQNGSRRQPNKSTKTDDYSTQEKDVISCRAARRATNSLLCHVHALSDAMSDVVATVFTTECLPRPRLHEVSARHLR
jgi:hypothetical protein